MVFIPTNRTVTPSRVPSVVGHLTKSWESLNMSIKKFNNTCSHYKLILYLQDWIFRQKTNEIRCQ